MEEFDEYHYNLPGPDVDIREERARYARSVYETSDEGQRLDEFADAMDIEASSRFDKQNTDDSYPLLQDVMDAGEQSMQGIRDFYPSWEKFLRERGFRGRPASLLAEVVYFTKGLAGVGKLAKEWGNIQPYGYLFWLKKLSQEMRWDDIIEVAKDALAVLKTGKAREEVSVFLAEAGQMANDPAIVLQGNQEKFYSSPCDANLKTLLTEAVKQHQREESLKQLLNFYARQTGLSDNEKSLYLKILLLAGNLDKAWEITEEAKSLGWSSGIATGLVFGSISAVAADYHENADTIKRLLIWYCRKNPTYSYQFSVEEKDQAGFFLNQIIKGLSQTRFQPSKLEKYMDWAFRIGRERVDGIVSNTNRAAYQRAAWILGSLAEIYIAREISKKLNL